MALTQKDFERQYKTLIESIHENARAFPDDSTERRLARKKRARVDKFFFASIYFPHIIQLAEGYQDVWRKPEAEIDWVKAGFAAVHQQFWSIADTLNRLSILAAFRESAKDTLLGTIDVLHKLLYEDRWFIPYICKSEDIAESKVVPLRIELEENQRIVGDFGEQKGAIEWEYGSFITRTGRCVRGYGRTQSLRGQVSFSHRPDHLILNDIEDPILDRNAQLVDVFVQSIRGDKLRAVNRPRWSGTFLCNWVSSNSITNELLKGQHTEHFSKVIIPALALNPKRTAEQKSRAAECREAGFTDSYMSNWEFRHPTLELLREQREDPITFDSEMMMRPKSPKDQKFKEFRYYTREQAAAPGLTFTYIDPSATDAGDYKALVTLKLGSNGDMMRILVMRASIQQQSVDWLMNETFAHFDAFHPRLVGVETNGFAALLEREYQRQMKTRGYPLPIHKVTTTTNKNARIESLVPLVSSGIVLFDPQDSDQELLLRELSAFPNGGNVRSGGLGDDGPDALAGCIELIQRFPRGGGVHYESLAKRRARFKEGTW